MNETSPVGNSLFIIIRSSNKDFINWHKEVEVVVQQSTTRVKQRSFIPQGRLQAFTVLPSAQQAQPLKSIFIQSSFLSSFSRCQKFYSIYIEIHIQWIRVNWKIGNKK